MELTSDLVQFEDLINDSEILCSHEGKAWNEPIRCGCGVDDKTYTVTLKPHGDWDWLVFFGSEKEIKWGFKET